MKKTMLLLATVLFSSAVPAEKLPYKVLICGVCKDVEKRVTYSMRIMEKIGVLFDDYRIIVYENNSRDKTPELIREWACSNNKVYTISEHLSQQELEQSVINIESEKGLFVPELIARARNIVLKKIFCADYEQFTYVIWMDMDFNLEPSYEGITEVFTTTRAWDAIFAYGIAPDNAHWDWYALRDNIIPLGPELLGSHWFKIPRTWKLSASDDWYPVYSAFGGCGIYKKEALVNCSYSAVVTEDLGHVAAAIIEHNQHHPLIKKYLHDLRAITKSVLLLYAYPNKKPIKDATIGIITPHLANNIVWRMNSSAYHYPAVCEHVPLHASMIRHGYNKLFINPRLIMRYRA